MLPSLVSQLVVLLKDTSLGFIIGYAELLRRLQLNTQFFGQRYWFQFFVVGSAIYIAVNFTLSRLAVWLERRGSDEGRRRHSPMPRTPRSPRPPRPAPRTRRTDHGSCRQRANSVALDSRTTVIRIWPG